MDFFSHVAYPDYSFLSLYSSQICPIFPPPFCLSLENKHVLRDNNAYNKTQLIGNEQNKQTERKDYKGGHKKRKPTHLYTQEPHKNL